jgi:hypothetical protein
VSFSRAPALAAALDVGAASPEKGDNFLENSSQKNDSNPAEPNFDGRSLPNSGQAGDALAVDCDA